MIKVLEIKNIALVEHAIIEFGNGLNILSGETGAGKSVVLDSINFALGAKADKTIIRHGENECHVSITFDISDNKSAQSAYAELTGETVDDDLIISRKLTSDGKSAIRVNGSPFSAGMLKGITRYLIDVHGQSEHYSLLKTSEQLKILDKFCSNDLIETIDETHVIIRRLKEIDAEMKNFGGNESERAIKADILKFQIDEITQADLRDNEESELLEKRRKIQNAEKISESFNSARSALTEENCTLDTLSSAIRSIGAISSLDTAYANLEQRLKDAYSEIEDVAETISDISDDFEFDESEADAVENRLDLIKTLKKKYGSTVAEINEFLQSATLEYDKLANFDSEYNKLTTEKNKLLSELNVKLKKISGIRRDSSVEFCRRVTNELHLLGMKNAVFDIHFAATEDIYDAPYPENGYDEIVFEFSANLGEPVRPLSKIISGGEMSRFMLALKTIISGYQDISTYVFDEIDVGISGATADVVARKFADISRNVQVIAVSHLPQVCAMSDTSLKISKKEENGKTFTTIEKLSKQEKIYEIMRIMSGDDGSEIALKHAAETVKKCDDYKAKLHP